MVSMRVARAAVTGALVTVMVGGCGRPSAPADGPEPVELRTYQVPPERQVELRDALRGAFGSGDSAVGRVTSGPGGVLLVTAPPSIQAGVRELVESDLTGPGPSGPAVSIRMTYWILAGRPLPPSSADTPFRILGTRPTQVIEPALAEIARVAGPTEFAVLDVVRLTSLAQDTATIAGPTGQVTQTAIVDDDRVVADVRLNPVGPAFSLTSSRVVIGRSQVVVLAEAGYRGPVQGVFPDVRPSDDVSTYVIVSADF